MFEKRCFADQWEETRNVVRIKAGCSLGKIVTVTGHSLRGAQEILKDYPARTSADSAAAEFENVLKTALAGRTANHVMQSDAE